MVLRNSAKANNDGKKYLKESMMAGDNVKDVLSVLGEQVKIKAELHEDAMQEIRPYLEQGV
jgi:hypothetical protein